MIQFNVPRRVMAAAIMLTSLAACGGQAEKDGYTGYIEADWVYVAAPTGGWLLSRSVNEGDMVTAGAPVAQLDTDQQQAVLDAFEAQLAVAEANARNLETGARPEELLALSAQLQDAEARLELALADRDRTVPLVAAGTASEARGDQVKSAVLVAQAQVKAARQAIVVAELSGRKAVQDSARSAVSAAKAARDEAVWRLGQRQITAKVAGRVEEVFHYPGEFVGAGAPILALLPADGLRVRFYISEEDLARITVGQTISVNADGFNKPLKATIIYTSADAEFAPPVIYSKENRGKLVFLVKARLEAGADTLRPGLPVDVSL